MWTGQINLFSVIRCSPVPCVSVGQKFSTFFAYMSLLRICLGGGMKFVLKKSVFLLLVPILILSCFSAVHAELIKGATDQSTFAKDANLATVTILNLKDLSVTAELVSFSDSQLTDVNGNTVNPKLENNELSFPNAYMSPRTTYDAGNFTVKFNQAARLSDGTPKDLYIVFTGVKIFTWVNNSNPVTLSPILFFAHHTGNDNKKDYPCVSVKSKESIGVSYDSLKVYVDEAAYTDTFFYTIYGVNVKRSEDYSNKMYYMANQNNRFSERVMLDLSGTTGNIYIPKNGKLYPDGYEAPNIFKAPYNQNEDKNQQLNNDTYESGFAVLANAKTGLNAKFWSSAGLDLYFLPDGITHTITSSSGTGGKIATGRNGTGTDLPGGGNEDTAEKRTYDVPDGKDVTYTMTPNPGYVMRSLTIDGQQKSLPSLIDGVYKYTFDAAKNQVTGDHTIHVEWVQVIDVTVTKNWADNNNSDGTRPKTVTIQLLQNGNKSVTRADGTVEPMKKAITNPATEVTFTRLPKMDPDGNVYRYSIEEDSAFKDNYAVTISPESLSESGTITVTNTKIHQVTFPSVIKSIQGPSSAYEGANYTFNITASPVDAPMPKDGNGNEVTRITIPAGEKGQAKDFGAITFEKAGTYVYTVKEAVDSNGGYTVTPGSYTVTYEVGSNGAITGPNIKSDNTSNYNDKELVFENDYPFESGLWAIPSVIKKINGIEPENPDTFEFLLRRDPKYPDSPMPNGEDQKVISITGAGEADFGEVEFVCEDDAGCTYKYYIREVIPAKPIKGVTYDETVYHVTINVKNGELVSREVEGGSVVGDTYVFTNTYPDTIEPVEIGVHKVVENGDWAGDDRFDFVLQAVSKPEDVEKYPMPVLSEEEGDVPTKTITLNGTGAENNEKFASFGYIQFEAPGEYTYKITEKKGNLSRYDYDTNEFTVTWDVSLNEDGTAYVPVQYVKNQSGSTVHPEVQNNAVTFRNLILPEGAGDDLHVEKVITGYETDEAARFRFSLTGMPSDLTVPPMPAEDNTHKTYTCNFEDPDKSVLVCALKGGSLNFYFGEIDFPEDGEYSYTVEEIDDGNPDIVYDTAKYEITYVVEYGELKSKTVIKDGVTYTDKTLVFTNENKKRPDSDFAHAHIGVEKKILGGEPDEADVFNFTMKRLNSSNPMPEGVSGDTAKVSIKASDEELTADFGMITFENPGVYDYEVREVLDELDHYRYDSTVYTVSWTVTHSTTDEDSPLRAEMTVLMDGYREDTRRSSKLLFENVLLEPNEAVLMVNKFVRGGTPDILSRFLITLKGVSNSVEGLDKNPLPESCEDDHCAVEILNTGHDYFPKIAFEKDGEYIYEVRETPGSSEDYEYDGSVYTVKYIVRDGKVQRPPEIKKDDVALANHNMAVSFENHYLQGVDEMDPTVRKVIKGNPNRDDVFTFEFKAVENDRKIPVVSMPMPYGSDLTKGIKILEINGRGRKNFGTIAFENPGKYVYTIREVPGDAGYNYDSTIYTVTYDVIENETGTLVQRSIKKGGVDYSGEFYEFTNKWGSGDDEEDDGGDGDGESGSGSSLPRTGFAPGVVTRLPKQRVDYSVYSQLRLRIPALGVDAEILGVPEREGDWDVSWLGDSVGWLQNTAWPASSKAGNAVITGHSYNYLGRPGVFSGLDRLSYGCSISVTAFGETFVYLVEDVQTVFADTPQVMSQKTDVPELTLITCKYYNEATNDYDGRVVVKAKLAEIR